MNYVKKIKYIGLVWCGFTFCCLAVAEIIWQDNFNSANLDDWTVVDFVPNQKSDWHIYDGYLVHTSNIGGKKRLGSQIVAGNPEWRDYTVRSELVSTDDDYLGILFRYRDQNNYYRFFLSGQNGQIFLEKRLDGKVKRLGFVEEPLDYCKMTMTAAVHRDTLRVYLNDREYFSVIDSSHPTGKVGLMTCYNEGAYFDNIVVSEFHEPPMQVSAPQLDFWCGPYLQNVLGDSATIMWQTTLPVNSIVEYGLRKQSAERIEVPGSRKVHEICLRNLEKNSFYYYRVISDGLQSDWRSLRTYDPNRKKLRFALYSDSQNNFLVHRKIATAIEKHNPEFIVHAGDLAHGGRRADWATEFFQPAGELLSKVPVYVARGNHAYGSPHFAEYFSFPDKRHETYYSLQVGNAYFIFLDNAKTDFPDKNYYLDVDEDSPQYQWLVQQLSSAAAQRAEWLFVVAHVPCYSEFAGEKFAGNINVKKYVPLYRRYQVDAVFSGHIHAYERGGSEGVHYVICGGAGGTLDHKRERDIAEIEVSQAGHHYCIINIEGTHLSFKQYGINGRLRDSFEIEKGESQNKKK